MTKTNKLIDVLEKKAPGEPEPTCPDIDAMQNLLETLRTTNTGLRSSAEYWRKMALLLCEHMPAEKRKIVLKKVESDMYVNW